MKHSTAAGHANRNLGRANRGTTERRSPPLALSQPVPPLALPPPVLSDPSGPVAPIMSMSPSRRLLPILPPIHNSGVVPQGRAASGIDILDVNNEPAMMTGPVAYEDFLVAEESAQRPPIEVIEWSLASHCISQDDEDELSLYIGAEVLYAPINKIHHSYFDLSKITRDEVSPLLADFDPRCQFVVQLHELLDSGECNEAITWLPNGRAFVIVNPFKLCGILHHSFLVSYDGFIDRLRCFGFRRVQYNYMCNGCWAAFDAFYHEVRFN